MKGDFIIDKPEGSRWDFALDILQGGKSFVYQGIHFYLDKDKHILHCAIATEWLDFRNLTEQMAADDYKKGQQIVETLIGGSSKFKQIVGRCGIEYSIVSDEGTAILGLYHIVNDKLQKGPRKRG